MAKKRRLRAGQSLVECVLVLPLLILLIVNVINFGAFFYAWISVANSARAGAQYFTTGGVSIGGLTPPAVGAVQSLIADDLKGLSNTSSLQVCVSRSDKGTPVCNKGSAPAGAPPAADTPEGDPPVTYIVAAVDVSYTYKPIIPSWSFPGLGIYTTLPPSTLHRQAKMRLLQ